MNITAQRKWNTDCQVQVRSRQSRFQLIGVYLSFFAIFIWLYHPALELSAQADDPPPSVYTPEQALEELCRLQEAFLGVSNPETDLTLPLENVCDEPGTYAGQNSLGLPFTFEAEALWTIDNSVLNTQEQANIQTALQDGIDFRGFFGTLVGPVGSINVSGVVIQATDQANHTVSYVLPTLEIPTDFLIGVKALSTQIQTQMLQAGASSVEIRHPTTQPDPCDQLRDWLEICKDEFDARMGGIATYVQEQSQLCANARTQQVQACQDQYTDLIEQAQQDRQQRYDAAYVALNDALAAAEVSMAVCIGSYTTALAAALAGCVISCGFAPIAIVCVACIAIAIAAFAAGTSWCLYQWHSSIAAAQASYAAALAVADAIYQNNLQNSAAALAQCIQGAQNDYKNCMCSLYNQMTQQQQQAVTEYQTCVNQASSHFPGAWELCGIAVNADTNIIIEWPVECP